MDTTEAIRRYKIIPECYFVGEDKILPTIGALCSGGLPLICVVMNGSVTKRILTLAVNTFPDTCIGARVCDRTQAALAVSCGVDFVCSSFFSDGIFDICRAAGVRYVPGCFTPTEIYRAASLGIDLVMISPVCLLSDPSLLTYYISAFPSVKFIADCSSDPARLPGFCSVSKLLGVIDGSIVSGGLDEIAEKCRLAVRRYSDTPGF